MEGGKKVAVAVVLILVIVGGVLWRLRSSGTIGGPQIPEHVLMRKHWKVCDKSIESMELTYKKWRSLGHKDGKYKNPKTNDYTMVPRMQCGACEAWIPVPEMPRFEPRTAGTDTPDMMQDRIAQEEKLRLEYKCPKCGELAMPDLRPPR